MSDNIEDEITALALDYIAWKDAPVPHAMLDKWMSAAFESAGLAGDRLNEIKQLRAAMDENAKSFAATKFALEAEIERLRAALAEMSALDLVIGPGNG